jgi:hypothetical protein
MMGPYVTDHSRRSKLSEKCSRPNIRSTGGGAYQSYKHNRYSESSEATLISTLQALAGLFLLNVLHKENQEWLAKRKVIVWEYPMNPIMLMQNLKGSKFGTVLPGISARSELFLHEFRVDKKATGVLLAD